MDGWIDVSCCFQIMGCMLIVGYSCEGHILNVNAMSDNALSHTLDL